MFYSFKRPPHAPGPTNSLLSFSVLPLVFMLLWTTMVTDSAANTRTAPTLFPNTHWSVILTAQSGVAAGLDRLCESYRPPLVAYLRGTGKNPADADDLVQGFFEHLLSRNFLGAVGPERGRFRTFLIASLKNYLRDRHDWSTAQKRGGGIAPASLETLAEENLSGSHAGEPPGAPDRAYDCAWAGTLVGNALHQLAEECSQARRRELIEVMEPILYQDETAGGYREAGERLGISEGAARLAAKRLRDRLRHLIRWQVRQTVATDEQVEGELRYLIELSGRR